MASRRIVAPIGVWVLVGALMAETGQSRGAVRGAWGGAAKRLPRPFGRGSMYAMCAAQRTRL
jgi:hypothetical protein